MYALSQGVYTTAMGFRVGKILFVSAVKHDQNGFPRDLILFLFNIPGACATYPNHIS
jgi:hypothetical protein